MPHVTRADGPRGNPVYQVGGKSFAFFRTPRPDAADLGRITLGELRETVQDALLARASPARARAWLRSRGRRTAGPPGWA